MKLNKVKNLFTFNNERDCLLFRKWAMFLKSLPGAAIMFFTYPITSTGLGKWKTSVHYRSSVVSDWNILIEIKTIKKFN